MLTGKVKVPTEGYPWFILVVREEQSARTVRTFTADNPDKFRQIMKEEDKPEVEGFFIDKKRLSLPQIRAISKGDLIKVTRN